MTAKYTQTKLPGGPARLIQIAEDLRERNTDGYLSGVGGVLAKVKNGAVPVNSATTCSPFTGTVIGVAFDPTYPRDDLNGDPYVPMCNGGNDPLPFTEWFHVHNTLNQPVQSIVNYGLGEKIDLKKVRRGDQLGIDWFHGGGHSVFVWDVHLDANGDVDCLQIIGSHGNSPGYGVYIYGCNGARWLTGSVPKAGKLKSGSLKKAKDKIFVDEEEIVKTGWWFGLPGVKKVDLSTFRVKPARVISYAETAGLCFGDKDSVRAARFFYDGDPPAPYCMKDGSAPAAEVTQPGHIDAPVTTVKGNDLKKDPAAATKVPPKPAAQDEKKPLNWQLDVEAAMQELFRAGWITSDPGDSDDINDSKTQAAIKEFQKLLKLQVDGIVGPQTKGAIAKQLPAVHKQAAAQEMLGQLFRGQKLKSDPGSPDGTNNAQTAAAVKEFQQANGLDPSGLPDADTQAKLLHAISDAAATSSQHGLNPAVLLLYWLGNSTPPGGSATLRMHGLDLKVGFTLQVFLKDIASGKEIDSKLTIAVTGDQSELVIPIPANFGEGALVGARVTGALDDSKKVEMITAAPLFVRAAVQSQAAIAPGELQTFFKFSGEIGEGSSGARRLRPYTYTAYKVPDKPQAWMIMGRLEIDVDGAPNCYHPDDYKVSTDYLNIDLETHDGALDWKANGGHGAKGKNPPNWFGVVTDTGDQTGNPIIQQDGPFKGFYVASTSLVDSTKKRNDPARYVDARKIPYLAFPQQVWLEGKKGTRFTRVSAGPTGGLGDILTVYNPKADAAHQYAHAVFADLGGVDDAHFGEGSPCLGQKIHAAGVTEPELLYIIYPHSGAGQGKIPTADEIQQKGEKLFNDWGGLEEAKRVLPLVKK
jgi:peptidoglycan hydrolase-like protein with peptidoglycan-binding domain